MNVRKILLKKAGWKAGNLLYVWNIITPFLLTKHIAITLHIHKLRRVSYINILHSLMCLEINSTPHLTCIPCSLYHPFIYTRLSPYFDQNTSRFYCGSHANLFWNKINFLNVLQFNLETLTYAATKWPQTWKYLYARCLTVVASSLPLHFVYGKIPGLETKHWYMLVF
jgi:hypothetical protein